MGYLPKVKNGVSAMPYSSTQFFFGFGELATSVQPLYILIIAASLRSLTSVTCFLRYCLNSVRSEATEHIASSCDNLFDHPIGCSWKVNPTRVNYEKFVVCKIQLRSAISVICEHAIRNYLQMIISVTTRLVIRIGLEINRRI